MKGLASLTGRVLRPALQYVSRSRLPPVEGRLRLPGLRGPVTVHRDAYGVPHIEAEHRADLFFAQGVLHAQDRLWQMELNRRTAHGHLAELFGTPLLDVDRLTRTLGFSRLAARIAPTLAEPVAGDAAAYAAGVNAWLDHGTKLPVEFTLLRHRPQPWRAHDTFTYARLIIWALSHGWAGELVRARLRRVLGPTLSAELEPLYDDAQPITLPAGVEPGSLREDSMLRATTSQLLGRGGADGAGRGSNAWVVAPERTANGGAILANDMHLPVVTPSLWYVCHLRAPGYHVTGVSLPGAPYVLVGHNEAMAWGATLSFVDCEDLFVEEMHPAGDGRYRFGDGWRQAEVRTETIRVKDAPDHHERVTVTHHGPLVGGLLAGPADHRALALSAVALQADETFAGFAALNEAGGWRDFVAAVARLNGPTLNLLYADRTGNIGHYVSGRVPIRAQGDGAVPAPGQGTHEWSDYVPFEQMPHALNPAHGYIVSANHRLVGDDYPYELGRLYMNGYRARRLEALLAESGPLTVEQCAAMQMDLFCQPGVDLVAALGDLAPLDEDARLSLKLLREWDGWLGGNSVGGAVYQVLREQLTDLLLDGLKPELKGQLLGEGPHPLLYPITEFYGHWTVSLLRILRNPTTRWLGGQIGREATLIRALSATTRRLRARLGPAPSGWTWGRLHQITMAHALAARPPLDVVFNHGPFPIGGDTDTVCQTAAGPTGVDADVHIAVSYRQILDLSDWRLGRAIFAPGQSGQLGSPHYGDLIPLWQNGDTFPLFWAREDVAAARRHTLILAPP